MQESIPVPAGPEVDPGCDWCGGKPSHLVVLSKSTTKTHTGASIPSAKTVRARVCSVHKRSLGLTNDGE